MKRSLPTRGVGCECGQRNLSTRPRDFTRSQRRPRRSPSCQAETLDPDAPGIEDVRGRLRGTVLYVGVSKLPEKMSPATAVTDSEKWAVELMFEGLLEAVPDTEVIRYRPALAESLPAVMPLGRSFTLPHNAHWSREPGVNLDPLVDARDVRGTLRSPASAGPQVFLGGRRRRRFRSHRPHRRSVPSAVGLHTRGAGTARPGDIQGDPGRVISRNWARGRTISNSPRPPSAAGRSSSKAASAKAPNASVPSSARTRSTRSEPEARPALDPRIAHVCAEPDEPGQRRRGRSTPHLSGRPRRLRNSVPRRRRPQGRDARAEPRPIGTFTFWRSTIGARSCRTTGSGKGCRPRSTGMRF